MSQTWGFGVSGTGAGEPAKPEAPCRKPAKGYRVTPMPPAPAAGTIRVPPENALNARPAGQGRKEQGGCTFPT